MKIYKIEITKRAITDIKDITSYIAKELFEPRIAEKLLEKFEAEIVSLSQMPTRNSLVGDEELAHKGIRRLFVDHYVIFYIIEEHESKVTVVRVLYGKRDWVNLI